MADTSKDIWNDADEETPKKKHPVRRFFLFLLLLVAVFAVVLVAAYRDGTGFDVLRRYFSYGKEDQAAGSALYDYDASTNNRFALLGDHLVVLSETKLQILDQEGEVWSAAVNMTAPALGQRGDRAVAYDVGGYELYVIDQTGELLHLTAEEGGKLIAATLNESGWLVVTSQMSGVKGCVSVYDQDLEKVFDFYSSKRFVIDGCVAGSDHVLAAVTLGQENSEFVSNIVLYDRKGQEPMGDYSIQDGLVMAIGEQGDTLITVSDTCLTLADVQGEILSTYSYGGEFLRGYDIQGEDFVALQLNRYQSGSVGRLVTVGMDGSVLGQLDVNQEILDLSAAGRYLAVLYADRLVIYNQELQEYASLTGTDFSSDVLMRQDGSAVLLASESAMLFLP